MKKIILDNRRIIIGDVADDVGISFGSCHLIFTNILGMNHVTGKIVLKLQNFELKQRRLDIAQEMLTTFNNDSDFLKKSNNW